MPSDQPDSRQPTECHFTYLAANGNTLLQGDVLSKTPELKNVLKEVHPHYLQDDYTHFLVLTQSCDLVRRDASTCKARYLTLAGVRPLSLVLRREIATLQGHTIDSTANVCSVQRKTTMRSFLERLFNNNNADYFYLHPEPTLGFYDSSCAFLRLSISLRTRDHYEKCLNARLLSLREAFRAKLGWLTGNVYSRVATEDWVPDRCSKAEFDALIDKTLDELCQWVDGERLAAARKEAKRNPDILRQSREQLREYISSKVVPTKRQAVFDQMVEITRELELVKDERVAETLRTRLENDPLLKSSLPR
jgi:hypothetical protein